MARKIRVRTKGASGCLLELLGLLLCASLVLIPVGLYLIWRGHQAAYMLACSDCGAVINHKKVTVCPGCRSYLTS